MDFGASVRKLTHGTLGFLVAAPMLVGGLAAAQDVLPKPETPFHGKIGRTAKD